MRFPSKQVLALAIGVLTAPYIVICWAEIAASEFSFNPATTLGLHGSSFYFAAHAADFLITLMIMLPVATALIALDRTKRVSNTALAISAFFVSFNALYGLPIFNGNWQLVWIQFAPYIALALCVWALSIIAKKIYPPRTHLTIRSS